MCPTLYKLTIIIKPVEGCDQGNGRELICEVTRPQNGNTDIEILSSPKSPPIMNNITEMNKVMADICGNGHYSCCINNSCEIAFPSFTSCPHRKTSCTKCGCGPRDPVCESYGPLCPPAHDKLPGVIGGVLGVLIVLVLLLIAILALKLIQMLIRKRRLELHSHRRGSENMEQTPYVYRAPRALPFPDEGEHMNGLVSQNGHLYAHLEAGSSYYECKTEVNCNTEQHVYEDADTYLKYPESEDYADPDDTVLPGKRVNGTNIDCNISPHSEDDDYANPNDDISGKNEPQLHSNVQVTITATEEVTDGGPETEEPAYAVLEQEIPDPEQGISDLEQGISDPEQETPDPEQETPDPELVPDNSGHSTMHM
jgi:hypothetical protein